MSNRDARRTSILNYGSTIFNCKVTSLKRYCSQYIENV